MREDGTSRRLHCLPGESVKHDANTDLEACPLLFQLTGSTYWKIEKEICKADKDYTMEHLSAIHSFDH